MADLSPYPDTGDETGAEPDRGSPPGTPLWVRVFGIIALVVILLFVILLSTRGPHRGPSRHTGSGGPDGRTVPAVVMEDRTASGALGGHDPSGWGRG